MLLAGKSPNVWSFTVCICTVLPDPSYGQYVANGERLARGGTHAPICAHRIEPLSPCFSVLGPLEDTAKKQGHILFVPSRNMKRKHCSCVAGSGLAPLL